MRWINGRMTTATLFQRNPSAGLSDERSNQEEARLKSNPCFVCKASPEWDVMEGPCFANLPQTLNNCNSGISSNVFRCSKDTFYIGTVCPQRTVFMEIITVCGGNTLFWLFFLETVTSCPEPISHPPTPHSSDVCDSWHLYKSESSKLLWASLEWICGPSSFSNQVSFFSRTAPLFLEKIALEAKNTRLEIKMKKKKRVRSAVLHKM